MGGLGPGPLAPLNPALGQSGVWETDVSQWASRGGSMTSPGRGSGGRSPPKVEALSLNYMIIFDVFDHEKVHHVHRRQWVTSNTRDYLSVT